MLGPDRARRQAELLVAQAVDHLQSFGTDAALLSAIAEFAVSRDH